MFKNSIISKPYIVSLLLISGLYSSCSAVGDGLSQSIFEREKAWLSNAKHYCTSLLYGLPSEVNWEWVDTSFQRKDMRYWRKEKGRLVQITERSFGIPFKIERKFPVGAVYAIKEDIARKFEEYKDQTFANLPLENYMVRQLFLGEDQNVYCIFRKVRGLFGRTHLCAIALRYEDDLTPRQMEEFAAFTKGCTDIKPKWNPNVRSIFSSSIWDKLTRETREWMEKVKGKVLWAKECEAYVTNSDLNCMTCGKGFKATDKVVPCDKHGLFHLQCYLKVQKEGRKGCPACTAPGLHIAQDCDRYEVDLECPVCQETLTPTSEVVQCPKEGTVGGHLAHMGCYLQWENVGNNTCPKCRGPITTPASWRTRWSRFWNSLWTSGGKKVETEQLQTANKNSIA